MTSWTDPVLLADAVLAGMPCDPHGLTDGQHDKLVALRYLMTAARRDTTITIRIVEGRKSDDHGAYIAELARYSNRLDEAITRLHAALGADVPPPCEQHDPGGRRLTSSTGGGTARGVDLGGREMRGRGSDGW